MPDGVGQDRASARGGGQEVGLDGGLVVVGDLDRRGQQRDGIRRGQMGAARREPVQPRGVAGSGAHLGPARQGEQEGLVRHPALDHHLGLSQAAPQPPSASSLSCPQATILAIIESNSAAI